MNPKSEPVIPPAGPISRRAALQRAVAGGLGLAGLSAGAADEATPARSASENFVPENDYPYFGFDPAD
jgi:hypothetical protein